MFIVIVGLIALVISFTISRTNPIAHKFKGLLILGSFVIIAFGAVTSFVKQINAGSIGVQVLFGQVQGNILQEGLNIINPLMEVKEISMQTQNYTMSGVHDEGKKGGDDAIKVLSKDGLEVVIDLTVLYRLIPGEAPRVYKQIGWDYEDKIIRPITRTGIREGASYFDATSLFSEKREQFENTIRTKIESELKSRGFVLEQMLVRNISLPNSVKESIERKITAIQDAQRMQFVLQKELQEAERKRVEAQGVADAQKIVNLGLSDKILQFEMIKVQKELANSPNSKIIIMGNGKSAPFIIGNEK